MAAIELSEVGKTYPGAARQSVSGVSLSVADGQFVVLVGPSGCGKSTLLRMVAGLETVTRGAIRIGDRLVNEVEPAERDIAMVFQNYALYPHMSVRDNLAYGLRNRGIAKPEIARRIEAVAQTLQIGDFLDRKPKALSGGQRQRVAMGRAMVREPAAFLFDEPLSNLDAKLRVQMRAEIRALQKRLRTTSLYVTHDQLEAMTLADKLVVLNNGHVEQAGTPLDIYETPASLFVAGFIGSPAMNLVPVESVHPVCGAPGLTLGIRPEHLHLSDARAQEGLTLPIEVTAVELVGAESYVYGRLEGRGEEIVVRAPPHARPAVGSHVFALGDPGHAHLFDTPSGRRLGPADASDSPFGVAGSRGAAHMAPLRRLANGV